MTYLFLVILSLAIIHFLYEGIIAPSLRLNLRYRLFALRDELRTLKQQHGDSLPNDVFMSLQSAINNAILLLHRVNVEVVSKTEAAIHNDKQLAKRIEERIALIENCGVKEVRVVQAKACRTLREALLVNNGGWLIYIVPIFMLVFSASRLTNFAKEAIAIPENELERIMPIHHPVSAY